MNKKLDFESPTSVEAVFARASAEARTAGKPVNVFLWGAYVFKLKSSENSEEKAARFCACRTARIFHRTRMRKWLPELLKNNRSLRIEGKSARVLIPAGEPFEILRGNLATYATHVRTLEGPKGKWLAIREGEPGNWEGIRKN